MKKQPSKGDSDFHEVFALLKDLALDLRWSWNHSIHALWKQLDPELWAVTRNPWLVLQTVSREQLLRVADTRDFKECLRTALLQRQTENPRQPKLGDAAHAGLGPVAYFSMEYMLNEALPIYSGGLGNIAGDLLKATSDLSVPVVGVGLLFQQGYFRQEIDRNGAQETLFPFNNPSELPITPVRTTDGEWVRVKIARPYYTLWLRAWQAKIGSTTLYLLDTNDPGNNPVARLIGGELYGDGPQLRLRQEIILGLGGWRLLRELGIEPQVCHLNEGHAAFVVLERARSFMEDTSQPFHVALAATRAGNVFTTHTPVVAGFDLFSPQLMESHLKEYAEEYLHIPFKELLAFGRANPDDDNEPFNMAYLAVRGSGAVNGVSRLHGEVSRRIFHGLFPRWPEAEIPVGYVTNGVHVPTWVSAEAAALWNERQAGGEYDISPRSIAGPIRQDILGGINDSQLWQFRCVQRQKLVAFARKRLASQRAHIGDSPEEIERAFQVLDPNILTLAFARRFAEYKRPNLLLHDPERLAHIITDSTHPAQLIIAGKAHPADDHGQRMIRRWGEFIEHYHLQNRVVFLADYDMYLTQRLVQGVDVWINTPRRPWEASGTSGMKVLVNGGLNLSELDGWWAEAYAPELGWAIGDALEHPADPGHDAWEANQLYDILEQQVKPAFYERDANGVPTAWSTRMRASMSQLTPMFSAHRALSQYIDQYYRPAALAYNRRSADGAKIAVEIAAWRRKIEESWHQVQIILRDTTGHDIPGSEPMYKVAVNVSLGDLTPDDVLVELFAENSDSTTFRQTLALQGLAPASQTTYLFSGQVPADRPESNYTVRVIPHHTDVQVPLEMHCIVWEK